jgi:hypothetical protein
MNTVLCIALFAIGHLIRDGFPATWSTHLARALGAFFCLAGASAVLPIFPAAGVALAILAGFYFDQKHGEGQNARGWRDACYLAISGFTSLVPLAAASVVYDGFFPVWIVFAAALKPPIWFIAWRFPIDNRWAQPTRVSAILFGAAVGAAVSMGG